jgi:hypothetical protein
MPKSPTAPNASEAETTFDYPSDPCVVCERDTGVPTNRPISLRLYYVPGTGQHCKSCFTELHGSEPKLPPE